MRSKDGGTLTVVQELRVRHLPLPSGETGLVEIESHWTWNRREHKQTPLIAIPLR